MKIHALSALLVLTVALALASRADSSRSAAALKTARDAIVALSAFGEKRVGTPEGARAGDWIRQRMEALGLRDVHFESFHFPKQDILSSRLTVEIEHATRELVHL